jgi:electron transfer flavoprotein beta subunit
LTKTDLIDQNRPCRLPEEFIILDLRLAVCLKQVPSGQSGETDPRKGFVLRSGPGRLNPFDGSAIELAMSLKDRFGASVDLISMGPKQAEQTLLEALCLGPDRAFLISDPALVGSDSLATARALALTLSLLGPYDLVVCGLTTIDGGTSQVPPSLSRLLGWPFAGRLCKVVGLNEKELHFQQRYQDELLEATLPLPGVVSTLRESFTPRLPSIKAKLAPKKVTVLSALDLARSPLLANQESLRTETVDVAQAEGFSFGRSGGGPAKKTEPPADPAEFDPALYFGEKGSPTKIQAIRKPKPPNRVTVRPTAAEAAAVILEAVKAVKS